MLYPQLIGIPSLHASMNQAVYRNYIRVRSSLFWYVREDQKEKMPLAQVVETILNYGDEKDVRELFDVAGMEAVAKCFYRQTRKNGGRSNYFPQTENFFRLFFEQWKVFESMTSKQFYDWQTSGGTDDVMRFVSILEKADIKWCAIGGIAVPGLSRRIPVCPIC